MGDQQLTDSHPGPPSWQGRLYPWRWVLLAAYLVALLAVAIAMAWPISGSDAVLLLILAGSQVVLQGLFLCGAPQLYWPKPARRVPMMISMATGALLAGALTFGLMATVLHVVRLWRPATDLLGGAIFWALAVAWGGWFFLFAVMWAGEWLVIFRRIYRLLIAGTCLELLVTIPVDVQVRRRTNCYCDEATFFGMIAGCTLAAWSFGPGLVLLFLTRRLQRRGYYAMCPKCTYDLRALDAGTTRCPECGALIRRRKLPAPVRQA